VKAALCYVARLLESLEQLFLMQNSANKVIVTS